MVKEFTHFLEKAAFLNDFGDRNHYKFLVKA